MLPVAILAGGLATRLGDLTRDIPKALLPVAGLPFIDHQLRLLKRNGCNQVVICAGHLGEQIQEYADDGSRFGLEIAYSFDGPTLLGTGGALRQALPLLGESFMVMYGDSYLDTDYQAIIQTFLRRGQEALMTVYRNDGQYETGNTIYCDGMVDVYDKRHPTPEMHWVDYGLGCVKASVIHEWPNDSFDLADLYGELARQGNLAAYEVKTRFYEIGSHTGLAELNSYLRRLF